MVHNLWQEKIVHNPSGTVYGTSYDERTEYGLTKYGTEQTRSTYMYHGRQPSATAVVGKDTSMSPRSTQTGLIAYVIEQSRSTYSAQHRPVGVSVGLTKNSKKVQMTPIDKARMQWARHKKRVKNETRDAPDNDAPSKDQIHHDEPGRSHCRPTSPERCPMYGDRTRADHRYHETREDIVRSRSSSLVDERDDDDADAQMSIFDHIKEDVAESFERISESFEEATKESGLRDIVFLYAEEGVKPTNEEESSKMITAASSFASPEKKTNSQPLASSFCGMGAFDHLCGPMTTESDNIDDKSSLNDTNSSSSSSGKNEDLTLGDDEEDSNTTGEQNLLLRETFSVISASHPDVGWKINVDKNNRRMVQLRPGSFGPTTKDTYRVAILDNRASDSTSISIKIANVKRDPALLSRGHFAGWDGKRSHYVVLTSPPKRETDTAKGVLGKLKELPSKWTLMNLFSQSNPALTVPREEVQQKLEGTDAVVHLIVGPEEPSKDGLESEGAGSSDNTGEEKIMLNKIMSGWGSSSFSGDVEEENDEEESYSPSTVGVVEVSSLPHT